MNAKRHIAKSMSYANKPLVWVLAPTNIRFTAPAQGQSHDCPHMTMSSSRNIFRVTGSLCGEFTGHQWRRRIPLTKAGTWIFDVSFDLRLNKRLSKHSRRCWFGTPPRSLWRHCNSFPVKQSCRIWVTQSHEFTTNWKYFTKSTQQQHDVLSYSGLLFGI